LEGVKELDDMLDGLQKYSFVVKAPNAPSKINLCRA